MDPSEQKTVLRPSGSSGPRPSGETDDLSPTVVVGPDSHTRRPSGPASPGSSFSGDTTPGGTTDSIVREGRFGKYQIFEKLGSGGFGKVYRGRDGMLSRDVAVKTCTSEDERLRRRFLHEAKIAAGLQHPHIVTVHDFGFEGDMPYMVQEYLTGEDLTEKIARRNLSVKERARYLLHIAQGLAYAHDHNVIHRDIKPGNIRITDDGQLRILDFGIARLLGQTRPFTTDGVTLGTVGYMAPELLSDDEVDWRCDIFSYGVVAYELLSYSLPFQGDTFVRISYRLLNEEPPPLNEVAPDCPPALIQLVERCLRKRREERYTTFHQVVEELTRLLDDTGAQRQTVPSSGSAPVMAVSGGAPTTPVPQGVVAIGADPSSSVESPASSAAPTAPVAGRRRPGMRRMAGIVGLALGAVVAVLLLPKTRPEPTTSPAQGVVAQEGATEAVEPSTPVPSNPSPSSEASTDQPEDMSAPGAETTQNPATRDPASRDPKASSIPSAENAVSSRARPSSGGEGASPTPSRQAASGTEPSETPVSVSVGVTESAEPVAGSPSRQAEVHSETSSVEASESSDVSIETVRTDPAEAETVVASTAPPTAAPEVAPAETVDASSGSEVIEPPPSVPVELVPPQLLEQVQPEYPSRARRRRLEATVTVAVWVEADGQVERTLVKSVSARGMGFEDAAAEAARRSRFAAGTEDGQPKAMWTEIVFNFKLSG